MIMVIITKVWDFSDDKLWITNSELQKYPALTTPQNNTDKPNLFASAPKF